MCCLRCLQCILKHIHHGLHGCTYGCQHAATCLISGMQKDRGSYVYTCRIGMPMCTHRLSWLFLLGHNFRQFKFSVFGKARVKVILKGTVHDWLAAGLHHLQRFAHLYNGRRSECNHGGVLDKAHACIAACSSASNVLREAGNSSDGAPSRANFKTSTASRNFVCAWSCGNMGWEMKI